MRQLFVLAAVAVIFGENSEIVDNAEVLVDDVLLGGSRIPGGYDVIFLRTSCNLQKEFEDTDRCLSGCRRAFQKFHRRVAAEEGFIFRGENQLLSGGMTHEESFPSSPEIWEISSSSLLISLSTPLISTF